MNQSLRLVVSMDDQSLSVFRGNLCIRMFPVSTAVKGMGFTKDSYRTPTGRFRISECIGAGQPVATIFKSRLPTGLWHPGEALDEDLVLTRILRLEGLDPENANTRERSIYIHGTNREDLIGMPAGHGCIRLGNADIIELFSMVSEGDSVEVLPATRHRGKLLFIACDSTLSAIEGIDELARLRGDEVFAEVAAVTDAAANGGLNLAEAFEMRMAKIKPDRAMCDEVARRYVNAMVPGVCDFIHDAKKQGWLPVILSGGILQTIRPLARLLHIDHVEAVPLEFREDGSYAGYGRAYPTTRNAGKSEVIREWIHAYLPERVVMVGDGVADLETKPDVGCFVGFAGVISRPMVVKECDFLMTDMNDRSILMDGIPGNPADSRMV